jgi:hypothetical protein
MILEEQQRQREEARERANRNAQREQPERPAERTSRSANYDNSVVDSRSNSIVVNDGGPRDPAASTTVVSTVDQSEIPADIPRNAEEDITAKQIRELAVREKDPVLREKYWNEYRKYMGLEIPKS